jgi:hypothetical protein
VAGDLYPKTDGGMIWTCVFCIFGMGLITTCVGAVIGEMLSVQPLPPAETDPKDRKDKWKQTKRMAWMWVILACSATIGAVFVHFNEGLSWARSFYWAIVTIASVGFGDITLAHQSTRIFCIFYILFGVAAFGLTVGRFASMFIDWEQDRAIKKFVKKGVTEAMLTEMDDDGLPVCSSNPSGLSHSVEFR